MSDLDVEMNELRKAGKITDPKEIDFKRLFKNAVIFQGEIRFVFFDEGHCASKKVYETTLLYRVRRRMKKIAISIYTC
jgi:hypothetical protein